MKIIKRLFHIMLCILIILQTSCYSGSKKITNSQKVNVYFINVGQGDSILIQYKGINMLIDAGPSYNSKKLVSFLKSHNVKKLDYVIATHPHEDHIGSMDSIIKKFKIVKFYAPKVVTDTNTFKSMITELKKKNLKINVAKHGVIINLDTFTSMEFLSPIRDNYQNLNNYSAVVLLKHRDNSFLFTGDAEKLIEMELLSNNVNIRADVIKVSHHGSSTSTSEDFIDKVKAKFAVISCGLGNDFGHPHEQVLKTLRSRDIICYRTDTHGNLLLQSDGKNISRR